MPKKPHTPSPSKGSVAKAAQPALRLHPSWALLVVFLLVWLWAAWWYGDVFHTARDYSFFAPSHTLMRFEDGVAGGGLWTAGRALLMTYKWPVLGGLLVAFMLALGSHLLGYLLGLPRRWRLAQYLPAWAYMMVVAYIGFDLYFEGETGRILGLPAAAFVAVALCSALKWVVTHRKQRQAGVAPRAWAFVPLVVLFCVPFALTHYLRPEVRTVCAMQRAMESQDWTGMQERARADADLSYRQIAAYYAVALVQRGNLLDDLFQIRLDYDEPYLHSFNGNDDHALTYYQADCDLYSGLVETAIHHAMERMTMLGPTIHNLRLLTKCALLRGEWEVAKRYLTVLSHVPFEGDFVEKYRPMVYHTDLVNKDPELSKIRDVEPLHDMMENNLIQPAFLGYNAMLTEGRSPQALYNSLAVNIYTKTMPGFLLRCQALQGAETLPRLVGEALGVMAGKYPEVMEQYPGLELYRQRFAAFAGAVQPYMSDRAAYARELFPLYKGYYGYYYFFGNLKATRKRSSQESSKQGVN